MNGKLRHHLDISAQVLRVLFTLADYRAPMAVIKLMVSPGCLGRSAHYTCPRWRITLERKYMNFCDCCGQRLGWRGCGYAKVVYSGPRG